MHFVYVSSMDENGELTRTNNASGWIFCKTFRPILHLNHFRRNHQTVHVWATRLFSGFYLVFHFHFMYDCELRCFCSKWVFFLNFWFLLCSRMVWRSILSLISQLSATLFVLKTFYTNFTFVSLVAPDSINHHVKTCQDDFKNMHFIAPEHPSKYKK